VKPRKTNADLQKFIEDIRSRQKNTVWPDSLRNGRSVDEFLWKGSASATLVQRMAAWLIGAFFLFAGVVFLSFARTANSWTLAIFALAWVLLGAKVFRNGFQKPQHSLDPNGRVARRLFPGYFSTLAAFQAVIGGTVLYLAAKLKKVKR
jgi:hypothetical protein